MLHKKKLMRKTTAVDEGNPYADGGWRFFVFDMEFGGVSGSGKCIRDFLSARQNYIQKMADYCNSIQY